MFRHGSPLTAREAYEKVVQYGLYQFHAQDPSNVVLTQIRRHCVGIDFPTASPTKHFELREGNRFWPLSETKKQARLPSASRAPIKRRGQAVSLNTAMRGLEVLHREYVSLLRERLVSELQKLTPTAFEVFAKELLRVYGFEDIAVTQRSRDGGIDGFGKLKVGIAHLNVAFQCKRWTTGAIHRPEVDRFRGAAQGDYEQGILFATTTFSRGAVDASIKRGAIPIILVDAMAIVDLMIEKEFGVTKTVLNIPVYALDLALSPENSGNS